jgi:hypothetical protein
MFFKQSKFHRFSRKNTHLMGRKMNANGRFLGGKTPEGWGGSVVKGKGTSISDREFS